MNFKRVLVPAIALVTAASLAACSNDDEPGHDMASMSSTEAGEQESPAEGDWFNQQDVDFARMMVPHHEQAIEMSDVIVAKEGVDPQIVDPQITDLANQIKDAQGPEIEQLTTWLGEWGSPLPEFDSMDSMDHGSMDGMMSDEDMQALQDAQGAEAGRLFLEQMIVHHQGAIEMAQTEVDEGKNEDAVAMAQQIVDTQQAEISTMEDLLASL
ncbi:DUF305 domain-containing protein [Cellulosimicrobium arenosum]|uniref:DUF305 domain-containing protein n=1 Tax=Cellulosimicrobium arenosum TaxID=2708133 RepID=A0A927J1Z9_9MICO|nr:DUF305 domain-containing protein [Cellulosimicrobium arenosum]MBD8080367.1 DUF305 domain-containing protein [Cellulosimicrobium arenosum]